MTKRPHNQTFKIAIIVIVALFVLLQPGSARGNIVPTSEAAKLYHKAYGADSNIPLSKVAGQQAIQDDTTSLVFPEDVSTYTDLNSCDALVTSGLSISDPENLITSLTWQMQGATETQSPVSGVNQLSSYVFNEGTTIITYRGQTRTNHPIFCSFTVTVSDNQVPRLVYSPGDITVSNLPGECFARVSWTEPIVNDNCASSNNIIVEASHSPGENFLVGETEVEYIISDGVNDLSYGFTITVIDREAPELKAPEPIVIVCGEEVEDAFIEWKQFEQAGGKASDNCAVDYASFRYVSQTASNIRCPYIITRTYSISDVNGNVSEVKRYIQVTGEEPEEILEEPEVSLKSAMANCTASTGNWNSISTWSCGSIPTSADNVTIPNGVTVTIDGNAECNDITIRSGGTLQYNGAYILSVYGDWTNSGTYSGGTNGVVEFTGSINASINGTTSFEGLVINKGNLSTTLTINDNVTVLSSGSLTMTSGLVTIPGGGSLTVNPSLGLDIESNAGFDVTGGSLATGNFSITNEGLIRISNGIATFGNSSGNEVHTQVDGAFIVSGGTVDIAGRLYNSASGTLNPPNVASGISISGGTITLATVGNGLSDVGSLHVTSAGYFNFSGGTIVFQNPSNAGSELDLGLFSGGGTKNTTNGTFQFGNSSTPPGSSFNISSEIVLDQVTSSANADLVLESDVKINQLSLNGATTIDLNGYAIQKGVSNLDPFTIQIDDGGGNSIPVNINLTSGSLSVGAYVEIFTTATKHPNNANTNNYLNRYWEVNTFGITNPVYNAIFTYANTEITGTESEIAAGVWDGSLPWIKYGGAASNAISVTSVSGPSLQFSGITLDPPTISINEGISGFICYGESFDIHTTASGDPGLTYSWSSNPAGFSSASPDISVSPTVTTIYTVTLTDGNGFTATDDITISVNPELNATGSQAQPVSCYEGNDGVASIVRSGGSFPYSTSPPTFNLSAGDYTFTVTDFRGCTDTANVTITQPNELFATVSSTNITCNGSNDGTITVSSPTGGYGTYEVSIDGSNWYGVSGGSPYTFSSLSVSTYNVQLRDEANTSCIVSLGSENIIEPDVLDAIVSSTNNTCNGSNDGTITVSSPTGGNGTYEVSINGTNWFNVSGVSPYTFNGLPAATYNVQIRDAAYTSCIENLGSEIITEPAIPVVDQIADQLLCHNENTLAVNFTGTATRYDWSNDNTSIGIASSGSGDISSFTVSNTSGVQQVATITVTPIYENGGTDCPGTPETFTVTVHPIIIPAVTITIGGSATICEGETASFTSSVSGTTGFTTFYQWQINGADVSGETGTTFSYSNFNDGDQVTLDVWTDAPCPDTSTSFGYFMTVNPTVVPSVTVNYSSDDICAGEEVTFQAVITNPGPGPIYQWQNSTDGGGSWNNIPGENAQNYVTTGLVDNEQIRVRITSNANCASPTDTVSAVVPINVDPIVVPAVSITATSPTSICPGETVSFQVDSETHPGTNPSYQWKVNGVNVGTDLPSYSTASLSDGDSITVVMTSNERCASPVAVQSSRIDIEVRPGTPAIPGTIAGSTTVCPGTTETYTVAAVTDATRYNWTLPSGWTMISSPDTLNSITVTTGTGGTSGSIRVTAENSCGISAVRSLSVSVLTESTDPVSINVTNDNTCENTNKTLSVFGGSLGSGAQWVWYADDCGINKIGTGSSISVNPSPGIYTYWVRAEGTCDTTTCVSEVVTVSPGAPAQPTAINGDTPQCPGNVDTFYIESVLDADTYAWSVPGGWTINSGQGDTMIIVTAGNYGQNGNISVTATNSCGTSAARTLGVTVAPGIPATPTDIIGNADVCDGDTTIYSINSVTHATSYNWIVTGGLTIESGQGSTSVSVSNNGSGGTISVSALNSCGESAGNSMPVTITSGVPDAPDSITGLEGICPTLSTYYTIDAVADAESYTWVVPNGWNIDNGQGTTELTVTISTFAESGFIKVVAENVCGPSDTTYLEVTIDNTGTVYAGDDQVVCEGATQVTMFGQISGVIDGQNDWNWVYDEGTMDDLSDLYSVYFFPPGFTTGELFVAMESNNTKVACGGYLIDTMKITVLPTPSAAILETDTVCNGESATVTISATPNTTVTYRVGFSVPVTIDIGSGGTASITVPSLTANTTFRLMSVKYTDYAICQISPDTTVQIVVKDLAVVEAGPDQNLCSDNPNVYLSGSITGAVTSGTWSGGAGSFSPSDTALNAVYIPTPSEISAGSLTLILTSDDPAGPCGTDFDEMTITWNQAATVNAGIDQEMCSDGTVALSGSIGGAATSATWAGDGSGSFSPNPNALNAIYTPSVTEAASDSFRLVLTTNDPAGVCTPVSDTVWVEVYPEATVDAGNDTIICGSSFAVLNGSIGGGATSATWSGGNGTFDPSNADLNAIYTPSVDEISDGFVTLTLTSNDPTGPCEPVSDQVTITLDLVPTVNAGIDERVCEGSSIILNGSIGGSANSVTWIGGAGTFTPDRNTLNATYTPAIGEVDSVQLILTTDNPGNTCEAVSDTMILMVDTTIGVTVGNDTMICSDATIELNGWVESGQGTWSTSGTGTFNDVHDPNAIYDPSNGDVFNETVTLTFTTEHPGGGSDCGPASASMILTIKEIITITTQPVNTGVCATDTTELFVQAVGDNLDYQWYYLDGTPVSNSPVINGVQTATLQFTNATSANAGDYYVVITSPTACDTETSDTISLNVDQEIEVTTPIQSDSVCAGGNITFWIVAEPGGSLSYQWRKDGIDLADGPNISGANNDTLVITNISGADAGAYTVYLTGLAGYTCSDAQSAPGNLYVIDDPEILPLTQRDTFCMDVPIDTMVFTVNEGVSNVTVSSGNLPDNLDGTFDSATKRFLIYGTPTNPGTFNFTLTATGFCPVPATATGTILINTELVPPVITSDQTTCYNDIPHTPITVITTPTGGSGPYIYQWQDSISGGSWQDMPGENATTITNPPALTETTYYRVVATDNGTPSCGSIFSNVINVIPEDLIPPGFTPPDTFTLTVDASCGGITTPNVTGYPISTSYNDNCAPDTFLINHTTYYDSIPVPGTCGSSYTFIRTWIVTDEAGNITTEDQVINLVDRTAPVLSAPVGYPITCDQDTTPAGLGQATAVDNCDPAPVVSHYDVLIPGFCDGEYTIRRHWIATDACGNADTLIRNYPVTDDIPPVIISTGDTVVECVQDIPPADPSGIEYYDECGSVSIELIDEIAMDLDNESGYCPYQVLRTWEVIDGCFNRDTVLQTISVADIDCPACSECLYDNTLYIADFLNKPYEDTTFYDVVKRDKCCGAENEPGAQNLFCASFKVRLDEGAVGVEILIDHVTPPGQDWQLNCEVIDGGSVVCLPSGQFHLFTFCKHANSEEPQDNDYTFRQVRGVIASGDIETREECDQTLSVTGEFSNPVWTSVYPGNPGDYDYLLSSTTDTIVTFNAEPGVPPHIQYAVCGEISATLCAVTTGGVICDTVDVYVRPAIEMDLNINPDLICEDYIPTVSPIIYPPLAYDLEWYIGATPSGTPVSTDDSYTPPSTGWYSVIAIDNATGLDCNRDTFNFEMKYDLTGPTIKDTPPPLYLECNTTDYAQQIADWLAIPTAEYIDEFGDTLPTPVNNDYYTVSGPVTMICGDTVMVTFTAMDQCSNDTTEVSYIYVTDTTLPVIDPLAQDSTIQCSTTDPNQDPGYLAWIANHGGARASDVCDPDLEWSVDTAYTDWTWDPANNQRTVTFTVTDDCGNTAQTIATFSIIDTVPPDLTCPDDVVEQASPDLCSKVPDTLDDPIYSDECSDPVLTWSSVGALDSTGNGTLTGVAFPVGTTIVTYRATDDAGLFTECSFSITIVDTIPPSINITGCQNVTETFGADECTVIPTTIDDPDYFDNCWPKDSLVLSFVITGATDTSGFGSVAGLEFNVGVSTVEYTVTDPDGNYANCSFTVTILRADIPWTAITCPPASESYTLGPTTCDTTLSLDPPTIDDYCVTATYTITNNYNGDSVIVNETFPIGTTEVIWIITDNSGNVDSCLVTVEISGIQLPTITCPPSVTGTMTSDLCEAIPPTLDLPNYEAPCWPDDSLTISYTITSEFGGWDTAGVGLIPSDLEFPVGTNTVWYVVTDPDGNKDSCDFTVTMLQDDIPWTAYNCPPASVSYTLGPTECEVALTLPPPTFNDHCVTANYTVTNDFNGDSVINNVIFPVGTTTVNWTITDNSGNDTTCTVIVEIDGIQLPDITCPPSVTGTMTSDLCEAIPPTLDLPDYEAPCWPDDSLAISYTIASEFGGWDTAGVGFIPSDLEFPVGTNAVWYFVTDPDGNKDSCDFTVTMLQDDIPWTAYTCPPDPANATVDSFSCDAPVTILPPTIEDHCVTANYTVTHDSPFGIDSADASGNYPIGFHTVTWTISDNSGNDTTCVQTFEVFDLLPVLECPPDVEVFADENELFATGVTVGLPRYQDNCDSVLTYTVTSPDSITLLYDGSPDSINLLTGPHTYDLGVTTIEYTFRDGNGHVVVCDFTVTVLAAPIIECPPDTTIWLDGTEDDCAVTFDPGVADLIEGAPPITWTYTINFADGSTEGPITYTKDASDPYANPLGNRTFPLGVTTIEWRAENDAGWDTCSHWIQVIDTIPPEFTTAPYENCVDPLNTAEYNESNPTPVFNHVDPNLIKAPIDYRTIPIGDTSLDLLTLEDNCCDSTEITIHWCIAFSDTPDPTDGTAVSHDTICGTGQPSTYTDPLTGNPADIYLWGDGVTFTTVYHTITYWAEDCNGNRTEEVTETITITPRPQVVKEEY